MKALRVLLFLALVFVAGGWVYWDQTRPEFPVQRTLVNEDGKSLEVMIVGKIGEVLHIERTSDGARFELPLAKLGWQDRFFAERLREKTPPPVLVRKEAEPEDPYIASRLQRIAELEQRRTEFTAEIKSGSLSQILGRKRQQDLIEIGKEIKELQAAIKIQSSRAR